MSIQYLLPVFLWPPCPRNPIKRHLCHVTCTVQQLHVEHTHSFKCVSPGWACLSASSAGISPEISPTKHTQQLQEVRVSACMFKCFRVSTTCPRRNRSDESLSSSFLSHPAIQAKSFINPFGEQCIPLKSGIKLYANCACHSRQLIRNDITLNPDRT